MKDGSQTAAFHAKEYGDKKYADFKGDFAASVKSWNPAYWVEMFSQAKAGYVVLTTKHHEGYTLWDSGFIRVCHFASFKSTLL